VSMKQSNLRDGDKDRYLVKGVIKAVDNVNKIILRSYLRFGRRDQMANRQNNDRLRWTHQTKKKLGANAILVFLSL